nr:hypothetical protein [Bifidobacterium psychraerophilum]
MISRFVLRFVAEGEFLYVGVHEDIEGLTGPALDPVVLLDAELAEERLVGDAAHRVVQAHVQLVAVAGQRQAVVQMGFGPLVLHVTGLDLHVKEREPPADALLFGFEQVDGDGSRVVGLEQFAALVEQVASFGLVGVLFPAGDVAQLVELGHDQPAQGGDGVFGDLDGSVVLLDCGLDVGHVHGAPFAVGALGVPAGAQEVGVDDVLAAARVRQDEPGAAFPAVDAALQIVVVGLGLLPGRLVRVEHGLDPVPDFFGHQRLVQAVVGRAPEGDLPFVIGVGQEAVHR